MQVFRDPLRQGVAWFRAGEFEKAEQTFARLGSPTAEFNRGNCLVMLGKYDEAISRYQRALTLQPDWEAAETNLQIAIARSKQVADEGGDLGDQRLGADEIVFDKRKPGGQETTIEQSQPLSDEQMQSVWLRRVQTKPAQFLKAKFAYQLSLSQGQEETP